MFGNTPLNPAFTQPGGFQASPASFQPMVPGATMQNPAMSPFGTGNAGGTFGTPSAFPSATPGTGFGGFGLTPPTSYGMTGQPFSTPSFTGSSFPSMTPGAAVPMQTGGYVPFQDHSDWRQHRTGELPQEFQARMFQVQGELDRNEHALTTTQHNLDELHNLQDTIKEKSRQLFGKAKLVVAKQQRLQRAVELRKSFEVDISNFMNEFLKLMELIQKGTNVATRVSTPASFLSELIHRLEDRVKALETAILELEDLLQAEVTGDSNATMVVQTLKLFQEKFEVVTALVAEVHSRVSAWQARYVDIMRDYYRQDVRDMFRDRPDELEILTTKAEGMEIPPAETAYTHPSNLMASMSMRDAIVGRVGVLATPSIRGVKK